jgi:hypothetical protein
MRGFAGSQHDQGSRGHHQTNDYRILAQHSSPQALASTFSPLCYDNFHMMLARANGGLVTAHTIFRWNLRICYVGGLAFP